MGVESVGDHPDALLARTQRRSKLQFEILVENVFNGLTLGAFYAMVTLGLALIFGVVRLVNFAHGDLFMVGGYTLYVLLTITQSALPYPIMVVLVVLVTAGFAVLLERVAIQPIIDKSWRIHAVATLGISIILQNVAQILFTTDPKQTPTPYSTE